MASAAVELFEKTRGGFNFDNVERNAMMAKKGVKNPGFRKTGTTLAGCVFEGGVVLGTDTRATAGSIVADKNCCKTHHLAENIQCLGAGTAADTEMVTRMIASQLELQRMNMNRDRPRVISAITRLKNHLFRYQGHVGAALILGGVDITGPHLWSVSPWGSTGTGPYLTMGSGSVDAMAVFEADFKDGLSKEEAMLLVARAIRAGIFNDMGSGSNVDITVIREVKDENGVPTGEVKREFFRNYQTPNERTYRARPVVFPPKTT
ncbi:MAG: hypothetical protein MHM6MM_006612, partial [Cercozoa sp. M6MM]